MEDREIDEHLKIYTNYVRVEDGDGDFHYDLYFNIQNLFNTPFEYISSVTNQANALVLKDSYLHLSGDKFKKDSNGKNVIDEDKMKSIREGGILTIYGQVKTYSLTNQLSDVQTIKLFQYKVYNISDDKPKFLMDKIYDITDNMVSNRPENVIKIEFSDVLVTLPFNKVSSDEGWNDKDSFQSLNKDVVVVQPVHIHYNWDKNNDSRLN